jgi:hypothetical protein
MVSLQAALVEAGVVGVTQVGHLPDHLQQQVNSLLVPAAAAAAAAYRV